MKLSLLRIIVRKEKTFEYYEQICNDKIRVVYWKKEFNYSAINNFGAKQAKGDIYCC